MKKDINVIELKNIKYTYKDSLMSFNLKIKKGEQILIFGPSGSGKSTLLNLIAGFIRPNSGDIFLNKKHANNLTPSNRDIAMLFQEHNLFSHLNIKQNIALGISPKLKLNEKDIENLENIAHKMQIFNKLKNFPDELSGGQKQRTALARALLQKKEILLLDEPFSALDPKLRKQMFSLINEISKEFELTTLIVSHQIDESIEKNQRCLAIINGKIAFDGAFTKLLENKEISKKLGII